MEEKLRILVVDDSPINLKAAEQKLKDRYEVVTINSGVRALHYLREEKPDLILLDIKMADKDGIETLKELRTMKNGADVPVIMLTSKNDRESIVETSKLGICDYVLKPCEADELNNRIERAIEKAREAEETREIEE